MRRQERHEKKLFKWLLPLCLLLLTVVGFGTFWSLIGQQAQSNEPRTEQVSGNTATTQTSVVYQPTAEEKSALTQQFAELTAINADTIGYVYAPGTNLDEPVVQTNDNATYLDKTFEGGHRPEFGTVFMDMDNKPDFSDSLTWLFGHARGSKAGDSRMFNDVNYYDDQKFFDEHPYVVIQTPERTYYYEAAFMIIVHESTAFYKTAFESKQEFAQQLSEVQKMATTANPNMTISEDDRYLVLSTCREDDVTIRANLYLRQIPDSELTEFLAQNKDKLAYQKTR